MSPVLLLSHCMFSLHSFALLYHYLSSPLNDSVRELSVYVYYVVYNDPTPRYRYMVL